MTFRQEWKASFQNVTGVCKSCRQKRRLEVEDSAVQFGVRWEIIMRLAVRFAIGLALAMGATGSTQAVSDIACPESTVPADDLVNDRQRLELLTRQATACVRKRRPARAVALLTEIIRQMPTNAAAYLNRGSAQATAGEVALAISDYTAAINLQPDLVEAWYDRGTTFMHVRRYENATADLTEAIRLKPDFALAYCNRGLAKFQLGDYDQALADYSTGIEHDDAVNYCYLNRGTLYLTLGEYQKAIDDLTRAIGDKPSDAIVLSRRGQAHEALGQSSRALDDFRAALEANPRLQSAEEGFARITAQQTRSDGDSRGSK